MIIKEFLPNPIGSDKEWEYIKIFNDGNEPVLFNGWSIKNLSGKIYNLSGELGAQEELILPYLKTKIPLNNNGETVFLYKNKTLIDNLGYAGGTGIKAGEIIRQGHGLLEKSQLRTDFQNNELVNPPAGNKLSQIIYIDFLIAAILAGLGLYIILQLEEKLEIKLF